MSTERVYLDNSATTPVDPRVVEAMQPFFSAQFGNPSSIHAWGREARAALEQSRETLAGLIGARPDEIVFTGSGTESDNHALKGAAQAARKAGKNHLLISAVEHHAVLHAAKFLSEFGVETEMIPVDAQGHIDPDDVIRRMRPGTFLISVMHANNEIGTIQPVDVIGAAARERGILLHTDAVQSFGKLPVDVDRLNCGMLSASAHKIHGPKGIGFLYIRKGTAVQPLIHGGAQEVNRRAGTENIAFAVGFARAAELAQAVMEQEHRRLGELKTWFKARLVSQCPGILFNGGEPALPNIVSVSFDARVKPRDGEALIMGMDLRGIAVTSGSACTSGSLQASHVLLAMGREEQTARATIRFSFSRTTQQTHLEQALEAVNDVLKTMG